MLPKWGVQWGARPGLNIDRHRVTHAELAYHSSDLSIYIEDWIIYLM
jgi:hypothetical protein